MSSLQQCPTKSDLCHVFNALTKSLNLFLVYKASFWQSQMTITICKLEHMCYLNVQAPITTENAYWLFVTAKRISRIFFA
jgi:hypothetical protein